MWKAELKWQGEDKHVKLIRKELSPTESSSSWESQGFQWWTSFRTVPANGALPFSIWWGSTWIISVLWDNLATNRALEQRAVSVSTWGYWSSAATCLTEHSYTQHKTLLIIYTSGIDSCLLVSFCSDTALFADAVGQCVNKRTVRQEGKASPS